MRLLPPFAFALLLGCSTNLLPPPQTGIGGGAGWEVLPSGGGPGGGDGSCLPGFYDADPPRSPVRAPPPVSGGSLAVLDDRSVLFADADRDRVHLVDALGVATAILLEEGDEPGRVVKGPAGLAFVALRRAGMVAVLDIAGHRVASRLAACPAARGLAWVKRSSSLFVACATGELAQLELSIDGPKVALAARTVTRPAADLRDVLELPDGLLLTTFRDALVFKRTDDGIVTAQPGPMPTGRTPMPMSSGGGTGSGGGPGSPTAQFAPHVAWRTVATDTGVLMVHQRHHQDPIAFGGCSGYLAPASQSVVGAVVTRLTSTGVATVFDLGRAPLPVDIAQSPNGTWVALAAAGRSQLLQLTGAGLFNSLDMPGQPTSVAYDGERLWVALREPATLVRIDPDQPWAFIPLSGDSVESTGHTLFHRAGENVISCASCHPEAGEDGHTWKLPEGSRRTPTLRGGLASTAPFHWGGEFPRLEELLSEILVKRMHGNAQSPERAQALLAWMDAQPALPAPSWLDAQRVARGMALFEGKAGCASCHAGAQGTNNATVDVGTDAALQVPRLVELARRAPYFHDGRIPTLAARFEAAGGGDRHGNVSMLTPAELEELTAYLASR